MKLVNSQGKVTLIVDEELESTSIKKIKRIKQSAKNTEQKQLEERWSYMVLHEQYNLRSQNGDVYQARNHP